MKTRYRSRVWLVFKKNGNTHSSLNTFWGATPKEIAWHVRMCIETWEANGWTLKERETRSIRQV